MTKVGLEPAILALLAGSNLPHTSVTTEPFAMNLYYMYFIFHTSTCNCITHEQKIINNYLIGKKNLHITEEKLLADEDQIDISASL